VTPSPRCVHPLQRCSCALPQPKRESARVRLGFARITATVAPPAASDRAGRVAPL
jgi:hypothetical protein